LYKLKEPFLRFDDFQALGQIKILMGLLKIILCTLFTFSFVNARSFTSADGIRKIEATITAFDKKSEMVSIIRKDGKLFNTNISFFSGEDQTFIKKWSEGVNENYLYIGKEYPGLLNLFLKLLNSGRIGYSQTILYQPGIQPVIIGNGQTPFLAWVEGYNKLNNDFESFNVTNLNFELTKNSWQARISFQSRQTVAQSSGLTVIPSGNFYGLPNVGGPILYQQQQRIVVLGKNQNTNNVIVLPRGPSPVYINPYSGGSSVKGIGFNNPSYSGFSRNKSKSSGISIQINR